MLRTYFEPSLLFVRPHGVLAVRVGRGALARINFIINQPIITAQPDHFFFLGDSNTFYMKASKGIWANGHSGNPSPYITLLSK